ncbi:MAG: 2,3-bisphosphoglycerate-independent phosphoglycerate mutase [Pseudomonadota bacterium]
MSKPVVLCILDGWGISPRQEGNAPLLAETPVMDRLLATCPSATLITHGPDAGLPKGQMGNSEVGHTNIGAGRVVAMDLGQIDLSIEDGSFMDMPPLRRFIEKLRDSSGTAHILGLVSDGGVHAMLSHLIETVRVITDAGVPVAIHAMTDGRDVAPVSAMGFVEALDAALPRNARIATVTGRYYAMDRDNRWDRVERAYRAIVLGDAAFTADTATEALAMAAERDETDEFVQPTRIGRYGGMGSGDGLFCINFRSDRAREIMAAIADPNFHDFPRPRPPALAAAMGMTEYSDAHNAYLTTVFPKREIVNTLGGWVSRHGLRQFRLAETEKYPHVTFFLNGGVEPPEAGEDRFMPPSPKVATYDLQPEMAAPEVTERLVAAILDGYDLIVVNYANPDMVGHTGDLSAAIKACEAVDSGLGQGVEAIRQTGGAILVTADHGNCDVMIDPETGGPHTAHTLNLVPVVLFGGPEGARLRNGRLADLAPTILALMELDVPPEMTGTSLIL